MCDENKVAVLFVRRQDSWGLFFDLQKKSNMLSRMTNCNIEPQVVVIRGFGGTAYVRWMIGIGSSVAYVTTAEGVEALKRGVDPSPVLGFPLEDVFQVQPDVEIRDGQPLEWERWRRVLVS